MASKVGLNYTFAGKKVLVTGGGRGIGLAIVQKFYADGAIVFAVDKDQHLVNQLKINLPKIHAICLDLTSDWDKTKKTLEELGPFDHLVNNAGTFKGEYLLDVTPKTIDLIFGVNFNALLNVSQVFVKGIIAAGKKQSGGTIVNISAMSDRIAFGGSGIYSASKAAVTMLTKSMGLEFSRYGVRVNAVCPSFIATELVASIEPQFLEEAQTVAARYLHKDTPLQGSDVADTVLFLSSPFSALYAGTALCLDGGTSTQ